LDDKDYIKIHFYAYHKRDGSVSKFVELHLSLQIQRVGREATPGTAETNVANA
jgi:hypothetical protein